MCLRSKELWLLVTSDTIYPELSHKWSASTESKELLIQRSEHPTIIFCSTAYNNNTAHKPNKQKGGGGTMDTTIEAMSSGSECN